MASVRVAVRLRPLNKRELDMESKVVIEMEGKKTRIMNHKVEHSLGEHKSLEKWKEFSFDHSYWSVDKNNEMYASQEQVFKDLGMDVIENAYQGYNACVFAYGQTGSGKTYTMMGNPGDNGLIPRICFELFSRMKDENMTYRVEVSYLEIYNEKVRDLLKSSASNKAQHSLRVREHPKQGPYVQDLSKHLVQNYGDIEDLMQKGSQIRTTASTNMNDVSSRSHAIFTIVFTQAKFSKESPLETHSKIHLVDLAGSERADATGATGQRLKEGGSINKSLVTLGNVISTLADLSSKTNNRRNAFIPYRDSVLTWLLKDSLGGNSKTIMIATISPAHCNYAETLSTLRYANRAKDIINKPTVNEDPNVKLIRELREEISRLRALLGGNIDSLTTPKVREKLHENEAKIQVLTEQWAGRWSDVANILEEEKSLALRKEGLGVVLDSELPHLIGIDDDLLSTGIMLYHLKEGVTSIGSNRAEEKPDIVLQGPDVEAHHCTIEYAENGDVTLIPGQEAPCAINGEAVTEPTPLVQGAVILLGQTNMFRFNHPAQAAKLRKEYKGVGLNLSRYSLLSQSMTDICRSTDNLALNVTEDYETKYAELLEQLEEKRQEVSTLEERFQEEERQRLKLLSEKENELQAARTRLNELEKENKNAVANEEEIGINLEEEKAKLQDLVRAELARLLQAETKHISEAQQEKEALQKELDDMRKKHEEEKQYLENQKGELLKQKEQLISTLNKKRTDFEGKGCALKEKQKEFSILEDEQSALVHLRANFLDFDSKAAQLSSNARSALLDEQRQLVSQQEAIQNKEKKYYVEYCKRKEEILSKKAQGEDDILKEREQLEADRIYTKECEEKLSDAFQKGEITQEKYDLERAAVEKEKRRIEEEWNNLEIIENENELMAKEDLQKLEETRASQITDLNEDKNRLKDAIKGWENLVDSVLSEQTEEYSKVKEAVSSHYDSLEEAREEYEKEKERIEDEIHKTDLQLKQCIASEEECGSAWQDVYEKYEANVRTVEERLENYLQGILEKRAVLNSVDVKNITNIMDLRKAFLVLGFNDSIPSSPQLESTKPYDDFKLQKIVRQESTVKEVEDDLENIKTDIDIERERDLDALDAEKYQLRQLEEQERINALVDQEMRKRVFEDRVEREKQRRIEREREKAERDRELNKIKRAHEKEMSRMQEKLKESGVIVENAPTRANPYASVMSGDATPIRSKENARKIKSKSMTNLARTQSISSLGGIISNTPITIAVPGFVIRGTGFKTHVEFEVKIAVLDETWVVFRRYSKFRELHHDLKDKFPEIGAILFPPKRLFGNNSDRVAAERRILLEVYLRHVIQILQRNSGYPLHPSSTRIYSKQVLSDFHPFFKKGIFENSLHGTS